MKQPKRLAFGGALWLTLGSALLTAGAFAQERELPTNHAPVVIVDKAFEFRQFDKVEITGSSIVRKEQTQALPVQIYTRQELQRHGKLTLSDALQNLAGVFNGRDISQLGSVAGGYANAALHGMPTGTLVLLNGKRLAPFGIQTNSGPENNGTDLDFLPLAAIDRIELLTDGASSVYGTDAIAGVINIITRAEATGVEVGVDLIRPQGGAGQSQIANLTWGQGRLLQDGYRFRVSAELSQSDALLVKDRPAYGAGRQFFEHNGQSYFADSAFVKNYSSPAWLYSPSTNPSAWSALYQNGTCMGNGLSYGALSTCKMNLQPTLDIYPSRQSQKLHAQFEVTLANDATFYAEGLYSHTLSQMAVNGWKNFGGRVRNAEGAPGYDELRANGLSTSSGFFFWQPDLPALGQSYEHTQSRIAVGVKGELQRWHYNLSLYKAQTASLKKAEMVNYAQAGLNTTAPVLLPGMLLPLDAQNPFTAQLLNSRYWETEVEGQVALTAVDARLSRSIFEINGKDVLLGLGLDVKHESVDSQYNPTVTPMSSFGAKRQNKAFFGELQVPFTPDWDVIASLRSDRYSDVGSTTHGKLATRWAIDEQWALRGAVGTGFRAPSPGQTLAFPSDYVQSTLTQVMVCNPALNDIAASLKPSAGSQTVFCRTNADIRVLSNGNPDLKPEKSQQKTLGLAYAPSRNFSIGLDYWRVNMQDTLQFESASAILADPAQYRASIVTDPKLYTNGTGIIFNDLGVLLKVRNWGESIKDGVDVDMKYRRPGDWGRWLMGVQGSYLLKSKAKTSPNTVWISDLAAYSTATGVVSPRWRSKWLLGLENGQHHWQLNLNYTSGYVDQAIAAQNRTTGKMETIEGRKVPGYATVDILGMVQLTPSTQMRMGLSNLLNAAPPLSFYSAANTVWGVNSQNGILYGRTLQLGISHRF